MAQLRDLEFPGLIEPGIVPHEPWADLVRMGAASRSDDEPAATLRLSYGTGRSAPRAAMQVPLRYTQDGILVGGQGPMSPADVSTGCVQVAKQLLRDYRTKRTKKNPDGLVKKMWYRLATLSFDGSVVGEESWELGREDVEDEEAAEFVVTHDATSSTMLAYCKSLMGRDERREALMIKGMQGWQSGVDEQMRMIRELAKAKDESNAALLESMREVMQGHVDLTQQRAEFEISRAQVAGESIGDLAAAPLVAVLSENLPKFLGNLPGMMQFITEYMRQSPEEKKKVWDLIMATMASEADGQAPT